MLDYNLKFMYVFQIMMMIGTLCTLVIISTLS